MSPTIVPLSSNYAAAISLLPILKFVAKVVFEAAVTALVSAAVSKLISA